MYQSNNNISKLNSKHPHTTTQSNTHKPLVMHLHTLDTRISISRISIFYVYLDGVRETSPTKSNTSISRVRSSLSEISSLLYCCSKSFACIQRVSTSQSHLHRETGTNSGASSASSREIFIMK